MLRFFRQIRKKLMEHLPAGQAGNKVRTYLLYAIGEIALVMIGILLALQVNNWNSDRLDEKASREFEARMLEDLYEEKAIVEASKRYQVTVLKYANRAIEVYENSSLREVPDGDQFLIDLYQASQLLNPNSSASTYQELISSGQIGMIKDDSLRSDIITFYNYEWVESSIFEETPYRENSRKLIPNAIQSAIRRDCGDTYIKIRRSLEVILPEECGLQFDPVLVQNTVTEILRSQNLKNDLRFKISTLDARILLLTTYSEELDGIIQRMEDNQ